MRQTAAIIGAVLVATAGILAGVYLSTPTSPRPPIILPAQTETQEKVLKASASQYVYRSVAISSVRANNDYLDIIGSNQQYQVVQLMQVKSESVVKPGDVIDVTITKDGLMVRLSQ